MTSVLGDDKDITRAHIQRMPYLQVVLKESKPFDPRLRLGHFYFLRLTKHVALRLYPPVPLNTRFCKQSIVLLRGGGPDDLSPMLVREGMRVAYSVYHMQRREDLYGPDAGIFRPERWEGSELNDIKWTYLPFNRGPRMWLGSKLCMLRHDRRKC